MTNPIRIYTIEAVEAVARMRKPGYFDEFLRQGTPLYDQHQQLRAVMLTEHGYEIMKTKYPPDEPVAIKPQSGAGTELKGLFSLIGIKATTNCSCNARARKMDEMGIEWCRNNVTTIVGWLQEEATKRKLPFSRFAARKIVQTAISRAERKQAKKENERP